MASLRVIDVYYSYQGRVEALRGANLEVRGGEVVAVLGPNGCGKTTLLLVAAGLVEPSRGEVLFNDEPLREQLPWARRFIGLCFQDPDDQLFNPTVYDEIAYALRQLGLSESEVKRRVLEVARRLGVDHLLDRAPYQLSFGEKRRVALASIIAYEPHVLLLDEPTSNLTPRAVEELVDMIREWRREGRAVVVATHEVDFAARIADRVYIMINGRTARHGPAREVLADEDALRRADLDLPVAVKIAKALALNPEPPLTLEELVEELRRRIS